MVHVQHQSQFTNRDMSDPSLKEELEKFDKQEQTCAMPTGIDGVPVYQRFTFGDIRRAFDANGNPR